MRVVEPPAGAVIGAIAAHPDDIESWCAGTLARCALGGASIVLLLVTSGEKGTSDPDADPRVVGAAREAEATEAGRRLGLADVEFLRYPDGEVEPNRALRRSLVAWLRRRRPAVVFTHDPERPLPPYVSHMDHRAVGRATLDAIYPLARDPLVFRDQVVAGLSPHRVAEVWLFASAAADVVVEIAGDAWERKIAARLAHASQTPDPAALPESWRARAAAVGAPAGLALAEAFTIVTAPD